MELDSARASRAYQRQKTQLAFELSSFLAFFQPHTTLFLATPRDIVRFLVWKDGNSNGNNGALGLVSVPWFNGKITCNCPTRLSAGSVDSLIGKLRSIFNALGRSGDWDDSFGFGNPALHLSVKQCLKSVQRERAQARVSPKQATPGFFDKLKKKCFPLTESPVK